MKVPVDYATKEEKARLVAEAESKGQRVLSDTFRGRTIESGGTLVIDDTPDTGPVPLTATQSRLQALHAMLKADTATLPELREMLRLERGL